MKDQQFFPYTYLNDAFVKTENAKVSIMTNAIQYGTGVFGGIRGYYNAERKDLTLFRITDHYTRFLQSMRILGVECSKNHKELVDITLELVKKNKPNTDTYFRPFAYASSLSIGPNLERDKTFAFALYMLPMGDYVSTDKGLSVLVSSWRRVSDNAIPSRAKVSGSYINSALAKHDATKQGYDEAIFLSEDGHVAEGSAMNLFIVRNGTLITPSFSENVLEGITRRTVIALANKLGIPVEERVVDRTELYVSDEAFFCGTGAQIAWIQAIDKRTLGTGKRGPVTASIQDLFFNIVRGNEPEYDDWLTHISI